jgi:uncharacterized protein YkwD
LEAPCRPCDGQRDAADVVALVNAHRAQVGCGARSVSGELASFAQSWSETQAAEQRMGHSDLGFPGSRRAENVARGYDSAAAVVDGWMDSPGLEHHSLASVAAPAGQP